jgi:drug/metabolite transporter (DMT)-like permease
MQGTKHGYFELAGAMLIVGSSVVVGKVITNQLPIFLALTLRFLIALPLLVFLCYRTQTLYLPQRHVLFSIFLQGLIGVFLFNVLLLLGLRYTSASQSGLLSSTTPALVAVLGWLLLQERISYYEWVGIALTVAGVFVVNFTAINEEGTFWGNLLVLGAFVCEALFTIFRKQSVQVPAMLGAALVTCFSLLLSLPIGLFQLSQFDLYTLTLRDLFALLYYGVFVSAIAYFLWFRGLEKASTGRAGVLSGLLPVCTIVLSTVFLGEPFTPVHLLGLFLVLSAIGVTAFGERQTA